MARLLDWKDDLGAEAAVAPELYFAHLRTGGRRAEAVFFIGQALPRHETVCWAARCVRDLGEGQAIGAPEREALKMTLLWAQDPSEARRRAAWEAAQLAADRSAERLAALAAFFSGGSLAPDDCPPVPTGPKASGRLAAGAVLVAAYRTTDWPGALDFALDRGAAIAERGLAADVAHRAGPAA